MKIYAVILLQILNLVQFPLGTAFEWNKFATRFAEISREAKETGSFSTSKLEELKEDMVKACKNGDLKESTGYPEFADAFSIPTQFYYLPRSSSKEKMIFLLPQIACVDSNADTPQEPKMPDSTIPIQVIPALEPQAQLQHPVVPADIPALHQFKSRFAAILQVAEGNHGYLTINGKFSLIDLETDMVKACEVGELVEVGSGSGPADDVLIPTKEYILPDSSDLQRIELPAVECRASFNRKQLERTEQQEKEDMQKKIEEAVIRAKNLQEELERQQAVKKVYPDGWRGFKPRYEVISENSYNNFGYLSAEDITDLERLEVEVAEACKAGEITESGPGDDVKDELERIVIPTKEYVLSLTADSEKVILPAVDCHGYVLQGQREKEAEQELDKLKRQLMRDGLLIQQ